MVEAIQPRRLAIAGATGYIGGRLAPRLLDSGYSVRCLVRSPGKFEGRKWAQDPRVEVVETDLADAESLCAQSRRMPRRVLPGAFHDVRRSAVCGAGPSAGFSVCCRSSQGRTSSESSILAGSAKPAPDLSEHLSSRREVERALASTGVPVTVLRAAMIIGSGSASFEITALSRRTAADHDHSEMGEHAVSTDRRSERDRLPRRNSGQAGNGGRRYSISAGPMCCAIATSCDVMAEELGLRRAMDPSVPVLTPRLSSYWIHLITPLSHHIARPLGGGSQESGRLPRKPNHSS